MSSRLRQQLQFSVPDLRALPRPPFIDETPGEAFGALMKKHKLTSEEYQRIRRILGRAPTMAELGAFSAMWSEHCSYKSSRVHLKRFPTEGPDVVVGPGENAGVVRVSGKLCVAFKMESHNHPSYIEPYQGAATGVGGILRDVFCMGARPIANLNALRFGRKSHPRTPHLLENVVKGIGDYGNCIGVPTVGGNIAFDESYDGNCLVNAMTVGIIHEDRIFKGYASGQGNVVVYVGSATGRDGIHGASMASGAFESRGANERSTVQVGDPFTEKLLLEATLEVLEKGLVVGLQDMGAAGLTSSAFEMAGRAGNGLYMDLDHVPVRTSAMSAYELLLSESQERMLMVIEPGKWEALRAVLDKWQLHSAMIGLVTNTGRVQIHHQGRLEVDVPVAEMTDAAPKYERPIERRALASPDEAARFDEQTIRAAATMGGERLFQAMLAAAGDKLAIYRQYDHHIGVRSVQGPAEQGAAVLWVRSDYADPSEPYLGVLTAASCNERYCRIDPELGASHAVLKSARMIAAAGGRPLALTDCLNYGNPEVPSVMGDFAAGVDGISEACRALGIPVVSGNVSLYNETDGKSIAPTPMIGMVGKMPDVRQALPATVEKEVELHLLCGSDAFPTFGGSLAAKLIGLPLGGGSIPRINWEAELEAMIAVQNLAREGAALAVRDVGDGGLATTAAKMVVNSSLALDLDLTGTPLGKQEYEAGFFGEFAGAYIVATPLGARKKLPLKHNVFIRIGRALRGGAHRIGPWSVALEQVRRAFKESLNLH